MKRPEQVPEGAERVTDSALSLANTYDGYTIATREEYEHSADHLRGIKGAFKRVEAERRAITVPMNESKAAVMDFFKTFTDRLTRAEKAVKSAMVSFQRAEQLKLAAQLKLEEERADRERQRLAKLAEKAHARGDAKKMAQFEDRADMVAAAPVEATPVPKTEGVSMRKVWRHRIADAAIVPDQYKIVDDNAIAAVVKALGSRTSIPGVEVWEDTIVAAGTK